MGWWRRKGRRQGSGPPQPGAASVPECAGETNCDEVAIRVGEVCLFLRRRLVRDLPHEVSAYVPRAEIRRRRYVDGKLVAEEEVVVNSLTIVHAPRHPPLGPSPKR
ncbi:MAG: hypothetical protein ACPLPT_09450 [Moorellales bacterium]